MIDYIFDIGLLHYLVLAMLMFLLGIVGIIISRNLLRIIMSMLLVSISIVINFITFGSFCSESLSDANLISFFVILISAIQITIALAIFFKIYQTNEYLDIEKIKDDTQTKKGI